MTDKRQTSQEQAAGKQGGTFRGLKKMFKSRQKDKDKSKAW